MARVDTIVVGGGIGAGNPFALNGVPYVANIDPPLLATTDFVSLVPTGVNRGLIVGLADPAAGPERLRVKGGTILESASHTGTTCIGDGTDSVAPGQILIGNGITAGGQQDCLVIGNVAIAGAGSSLVIGHGATLRGAGICIGGVSSAFTGTQYHIVIGGTSATGNNLNHLNIGGSCNPTTGVTCLGTSAIVTAVNAVCIGGGSSVAASGGITIGGVVSAGHTNSISIGTGCGSIATRTFSVGSNAGGDSINQFIIGHGLTAIANPTAVLFRLTNASGNNNAAGAMTLQAGLSTGNVVGPAVNLAVGAPGASGVVLQTQRIGVSCSPSTTATETYLMVYDVDNNVLERVSVGAADSGGPGFKVLRIPN